MKRLLSLIAMIGIILAIAVPMGAMAADEIIGYEFNGSSNGWVYSDSASIGSSVFTTDSIKLPTGKLLYYNTVSSWGDNYTFSLDLELSDSNSNTVSVYFNSNSEFVGHRLDLQMKNTSTGNVWGRVCDSSDYNSRNNSLATLDFSSASDAYKTAINNKWHVEIGYNKGNIQVWLRPLSYSGDALKVVDYTTTSSTYKKGKIGFKTQIYSTVIKNIKVEKAQTSLENHDYNWNGNDNDWTFFKHTNGTGSMYVENGQLLANGTSANGRTFAKCGTVNWSGNTTIKTYLQAYCSGNASSVSVLFNCKDGDYRNCYKIELADRKVAYLKKMTNDSSQLLGQCEITNGTDGIYNFFYYGDLEINVNSGKINAWFTSHNNNNTRKQIFTNVEDSTYTSGSVIFEVKTANIDTMPIAFKNITIDGDMTASNAIVNGQVTGVQKLANGTLTTVEFSGTGFEAEAGATLTNDMDLKVPVRYAKASGNVDAAVLVAYYGTGDVMLDVDMEKVSLSSANKEWIDVPIGKAMPSGTTKVRCFVWNASTLCPALELSHSN